MQTRSGKPSPRSARSNPRSARCNPGVPNPTLGVPDAAQECQIQPQECQMQPQGCQMQSQECQPQPQAAPAPVRLTRLPGPDRKAQSSGSAFPPSLWKQKSSDSEPSPGCPCSPCLLSKAASGSLCVSQGRGGWGTSQNDWHMLAVTGAGEFWRPMPCSNPALPPSRCFL